LQTTNYLDMDYQDYKSLAGPSPGEYADNYPDDFAMHRSSQLSRSQQPLRNLQHFKSQQCPFLPPKLWNALPKEAQEILKNFAKDKPVPASRGPSKLMTKVYDHHLGDDPGIDLDSQGMHSADLTPHGDQELAHAEPLGENKDPCAAPLSPAPNEDVQTLISTNDCISCADCISCTPDFYLESDSLQVCHSLLL